MHAWKGTIIFFLLLSVPFCWPCQHDSFGIHQWKRCNTFIKDLENVDYIVGHNVGYDLRVIVNNLRKYEITIITDNKVNNNIFSNIPIKDTYQMSKKSLEQLHQELFNEPVYGAHNAINDVLATFECYKKIIDAL